MVISNIDNAQGTGTIPAPINLSETFSRGGRFATGG
jgi:hypothetical protein